MNQTTSPSAPTTVGRFTYDPATSKISGPADYMRDRFGDRMAEIYAGRDIVFTYGATREGSDPVVAILVSLQTDYAGYAGARSFS